MATTYNVSAITYLARQDGNENGMVKQYEVYLSTDGKTWGTAAVSGEFKKTTALQVATLPAPKKARYMKFVAKSEINNRAWTSAAEIGIQIVSETTAINHARNEEQGMRNIYNLQGRRLSGPADRGIYIQNGKKVAIK
jgi:hypothetical protein